MSTKGQKIGRRQVLRTGAVGAVVAGLNTATMTWVGVAQANSFAAVPPLDGELSFQPEDLAAAADDFGHIVSNSPTAVLFPGSVNDIVVMVEFAREHGLHVAMRGQGHSQLGQAQAAAGVVIDSRGLSAIEEIGADYAVVQAGVLWSELVEAAFAQDLTPPVLTDFLELSIGGTLCVGGIGGAVQHHGIQADNVLELEVVTGRGQRVTCSSTQRRLLFRAVLAGMGQVALIVRAKVRLIPAHQTARVFLLAYDNLETFLNDQQLLLAEGRFDYLEGQAVPLPNDAGWSYVIEAAAFFTSPSVLDNAALLTGLADDPSSRQVSDQGYLQFAFRLAPLIAQLQALGVWDFPHPWVNLWVPASAAAQYLGQVFDNLTVEDTGQGPVLLYPINTSRVSAPLFKLPSEPVCFSFSVLRTAPPIAGVAEAMVAANRALYDQLVPLGGTRYCSGAIPFSAQDWRDHFGPIMLPFALAKLLHDPDRVLTPGPGVF